MAISFPCPDCKGVNTFEDSWVGLRAPCQRCGSYLTVPAQSSASPDQIVEGPPRPPLAKPVLPSALPTSSTDWVTELPKARDYETGDYARRGTFEEARALDDWRGPLGVSPGWNSVRIGLGMMFWGIIALIVVLIFYVVFSVLLTQAVRGGRGGFGANRETLGILGLLLGGLTLITSLVVFVGQCMCIAAPPESEGRGLAIASVVLGVGALLLVIVLIFLLLAIAGGPFGNPRFGGGPDVAAVALPLVLGLLALAALVTSHVLFILFLKAVGRYFRNQTLVQSTSGYLILYFITMASAVVLQCVGIGAVGANATSVGCFGIIVLGLDIAVAVWYLILLARARGSIG